MFGHKILRNRLQVGQTKIDVISKLPPSILVRRVRNFLGHVGSIEDSS